MTTTATNGRSIVLPDLSGWWGADALDELDGLGLASAPCFLDVEDVTEAGYVIGQDPPPNQPCRKKQIIQINIGKHPDHDPAELIERVKQQPASVQPSLTAPLTFPSGRTDGAPSAGTPWTEPAPDTAPPSSILPRPITAANVPPAAPQAPVAPTPTSPTQEHQGAVPTPDQYATKTSQPRASTQRPGSAGPNVFEAAAAATDANATADSATQETYDFSAFTPAATPRVAYSRPAGRRARKRRRFQRMTLKQKIVAGGLAVVFIALFVLTMSSHAPKQTAAQVRANTHPYATTKARSSSHHPARHSAASQPAKPKTVAKTKHVAKVRTIVRVRTIIKRGPVRTRTVTVPASTPTSSHVTQPSSSYSPPVSDTPASSSATSSSQTATSAPSTKGATTSTPSSSESRPSTSASSKGGGGSALQNPDGAASPPTPTQP